MAAPVIETDFPFTVFSLEADRDYLLARHLSFTGGGFHSRAGFMGQQACEKYMKAILVQGRARYPLTHQLLPLAEACAELDPFFSEEKTKATLRTFDYFEQVGRYGAAAKFDPLAIKTAEIKTAGVMVWQEDYLYQLDAFVFKARAMLDFKKINFSDSLAAILAHNKKDILSSTWRGRPPLFVILTKKNNYFKG